MLRDRRGKFKLTSKFVEGRVNLEFLHKLMGSVSILRAELKYDDFCVHYDAISEHFREISVGEEIPKYACLYNSNDKTIKWEEIK